jgi:hypothetical protein
MPGRPPKTWFDRCVEDVAASGYADAPAAVCGATWARKSPTEKAATTRAEEASSMAKHHGTHHAKKHAKKHGKHGGKLHGAALTAWKKAHGMTKHHRPPAGRRGAHHKSPRAAAHKVHHHRCILCGHAAKHDASAGCLHRDGKGKFCTCRHRG